MLKLPLTFRSMPSIPTARSHFKEAHSLLLGLLDDETFLDAVDMTSQIITATLQNGCKIISCGNGGSMSDACHFAEELSGKFREDRPAYAAMALSDSATLTCIANDYSFENVFSRQIEALGNKGDILFAISTSGNSPNIIKAAKAARAKNMLVVALTGNDGGELASVVDHEIRVPWTGYSDRIQEVHIKCIHAIISSVESQLQA
jgi:D-sedoheptulose 7-phosphate isomerase